jgi:hypothetical protein
LQGQAEGTMASLADPVYVVKVKFTLEQTVKAQRGSRSIALLIL